MTKQLIKDFGFLLNDGRLGFVDVRNLDSDTVRIGAIVYSDAVGHNTFIRDVILSYANLLECVVAVYERHPVRKDNRPLIEVKFDSKSKRQSARVTWQSDFEFYGVRFRTISDNLADALLNDAYIYDIVTKVYDATYFKYVSTCDYGYYQQIQI